MNYLHTPIAGDIGKKEKRRWIEIEPVENPASTPAEPVVAPERETQPA